MRIDSKQFDVALKLNEDFASILSKNNEVEHMGNGRNGKYYIQRGQ